MFFNLCNPDSLGGILAIIIQLLGLAVFFRAIISWVIRDPLNPIVRALDTVTEPILQPLRQIVPRMGMFDLTPLVAIIVLSFIGRLLCNSGI